jgi:hypothetical protein
MPYENTLKRNAYKNDLKTSKNGHLRFFHICTKISKNASAKISKLPRKGFLLCLDGHGMIGRSVQQSKMA